MSEPSAAASSGQSGSADAEGGKSFSRWIYVVAVLALFAYAAWIMGPYLRSIVVRDAAVTSWLNVSTAPIDGMLQAHDRSVLGSIGADGIVEIVRNDRLSRKNLVQARIQVDLAAARVKEVQEYLNEIIALDKGRAELKARYADYFRGQLDAEIAGIGREIGVTRDRLELIRQISKRHGRLLARGNVSKTAADETLLRVADLELQLANLRKDLSYAKVRRKAADNSVFITPVGDDPAWVQGSRTELKLQKKNARLELRQAEAGLATAEAALKVAEEDFALMAEAYVRAPPGSIVWSQRAAPGRTVRAGEPVVEWLDCSNLMIDVPVADAEVPLIEIGSEAEVVLEGDPEVRMGQVLMTRGSASTLGSNDLAALAKGRGDGVAQVLLEFSHERADFKSCPVGRAAYVNFPKIGLIDIIRARLRL
jgi:multidrug resistance efflux pump